MLKHFFPKTCAFLTAFLLAAVLFFAGCTRVGELPVHFSGIRQLSADGLISGEILKQAERSHDLLQFEQNSENCRSLLTLFGSKLKNSSDIRFAPEVRKNGPDEFLLTLPDPSVLQYESLISIELYDEWKGNAAEITVITEDGETTCPLYLSAAEAAQRKDDAPSIPQCIVCWDADSGHPFLHLSHLPEADAYRIRAVDLPQVSEGHCLLTIDCCSVFQRLDELAEAKLGALPADGILIPAEEIAITPGENVFDMVKRILPSHGVRMESTKTPLYNGIYIQGMQNLYEFDCGPTSGWMYSSDGWFPNYSCSQHLLQGGEVVRWRYTCRLGHDIGGMNRMEARHVEERPLQ